jgi:hypothetical protein
MRWAGHVVRVGKGEANTGFWLGNLRARDNFENLNADGRIILKRIFKKWDGSINWIDLAQDRDMWRAVVSAVMNLWVI